MDHEAHTLAGAPEKLVVGVNVSTSRTIAWDVVHGPIATPGIKLLCQVSLYARCHHLVTPRMTCWMLS